MPKGNNKKAGRSFLPAFCCTFVLVSKTRLHTGSEFGDPQLPFQQPASLRMLWSLVNVPTLYKNSAC